MASAINDIVCSGCGLERSPTETRCPNCLAVNSSPYDTLHNVSHNSIRTGQDNNETELPHNESPTPEADPDSVVTVLNASSTTSAPQQGGQIAAASFANANTVSLSNIVIDSCSLQKQQNKVLCSTSSGSSTGCFLASATACYRCPQHSRNLSGDSVHIVQTSEPASSTNQPPCAKSTRDSDEESSKSINFARTSLNFSFGRHKKLRNPQDIIESGAGGQAGVSSEHTSTPGQSNHKTTNRWAGGLARLLPGLMRKGREHGLPDPHPAVDDGSCVCTGYRRTEEHVLGPGLVFSASQNPTSTTRPPWDWLQVIIPPPHRTNNQQAAVTPSSKPVVTGSTFVQPGEVLPPSEVCFYQSEDIDSILLAKRAYDIEQGIEISPAQLQDTQRPSTSAMPQRPRQRASHGYKTIHGSSPERSPQRSDGNVEATPPASRVVARNSEDVTRGQADSQWNSLTASRVSAVVAAAANDIDWATGHMSNPSAANMPALMSGCSLVDTNTGSNTSLSSSDQFYGSNTHAMISRSGSTTTTDTIGIPGSATMSSVHTQVDYIHCFAPDMQQVSACSFYWGVMDRYEAERLLDSKPEGTFLLRDSAQDEYMFSVSFRRYGRSLHARVEQWNHRFSFDSHDPGVYSSPTVCGLVKHYNDPGCCMFFEPMLTLPLPRTFTFSLQQLCRSVISANTTYDGVSALPLPASLKEYLKVYHYKQKVRVRTFDTAH